MEQGTSELAGEAPAKLCECGCGQPAPIARMTSKRWGHVQGQPTRFVQGHRAGRNRVEVGRRFGRGVVIDAEVRIGRNRKARLLCDCGNEFVRSIRDLLQGNYASCGCFRVARSLDRLGQRSGRLVVIRRAERGACPADGGVWWWCKCDCGNEVLAKSSALANGHKRSCGCLKKGPRQLPAGVAALNKALNGYRQAAKQRGLAWALAKEDFYRLTAMDCHYCGAPPVSRIRNGRYNGESVYNGLDRIDSSEGYLLGNLVPCCPVCNHAKRDMPYGEFLAWIARLTEYHFFHPDVMPSALPRKAAG